MYRRFWEAPQVLGKLAAAWIYLCFCGIDLSPRFTAGWLVSALSSSLLRAASRWCCPRWCLLCGPFKLLYFYTTLQYLFVIKWNLTSRRWNLSFIHKYHCRCPAGLRSNGRVSGERESFAWSLIGLVLKGLFFHQFSQFLSLSYRCAPLLQLRTLWAIPSNALLFFKHVLTNMIQHFPFPLWHFLLLHPTWRDLFGFLRGSFVIAQLSGTDFIGLECFRDF